MQASCIKTFQPRLAAAARAVSSVIALLAVSACAVRPQKVNATAVLDGRDGLSRPTSKTLTLAHDPTRDDEPRVITERHPMVAVKGFAVRVDRAGIPIDESFVLVSISRAGTAPGSSDPQPVVVADDRNFVLDHTGRLDVVGVDTGRIDALLTKERRDVFSGRQRAGYALFARWHAQDPCMPFSDPAATTDTSRLASGMFESLSSIFTRADAASNLFSLGGSQNDGDFELYFVPHIPHSTFVDQTGGATGGFTFLFKASIRAGLATANVYIPLSFVAFQQSNGTIRGDTLELRLDLIDFRADRSDDRKRVTVMAEGGFARDTAVAIRQALLDEIDGISTEQRTELGRAVDVFASQLNALIPGSGTGAVLPPSMRVALFPGILPSDAVNRLLPSAGLQPRLCILSTVP